jgi:hypothetical protein
MKRKSIIQRLLLCALIFMSFLLVGCLPLPKLVNRVGGLGPEYPEGKTSIVINGLGVRLSVLEVRPKYPKEQTAIVKGSTHSFLTLIPPIYISSTAKIAAVDKKFFDYHADEVRISPGPHEVLITIEKKTHLIDGNRDHKKTSRLLYFEFDAKAGHTYKVHIPLYWRKNSIIKIVDKATNEIVGSQVASQ